MLVESRRGVSPRRSHSKLRQARLFLFITTITTSWMYYAQSGNKSGFCFHFLRKLLFIASFPAFGGTSCATRLHACPAPEAGIRLRNRKPYVLTAVYYSFIIFFTTFLSAPDTFKIYTPLSKTEISITVLCG